MGRIAATVTAVFATLMLGAGAFLGAGIAASSSHITVQHSHVQVADPVPSPTSTGNMYHHA